MKAIFELVKPGIIFGNIITLCGGYFIVASEFKWFNFITTILGMSLIIGSGCILNNYIDRDIDRLMNRTRFRLLARREVSKNYALNCSLITGITGFLMLYLGTNILVVSFASFGLLIYVIVYSIFLKRTSLLSVPVGALSGALPPLIGYVSVHNNLDLIAILLFLILFFWQIPHFYAISILYEKDYEKANIPLISKSFGLYNTKIIMFVFVLFYFFSLVTLGVTISIKFVYFLILIPISLYWIVIAIQGFFNFNVSNWSKKMFNSSMINILLFSGLIMVI